MTEQYGYAGNILRVDLSSGGIACIPTGEYADLFIGGKGIAAKIYWDEVTPGVKALDPENLLMFMIGPLAGFPGLAGSRTMVCSKCPLTLPEQFTATNLGGTWGAELKFAGYDGIVFKGRSDKPVYLWVQDNVVELRDACSLWGKGVYETRESLKRENGDSFKVMAIGPAGENVALSANIMGDGDASGGGGFGTVMGSKKLKAIVVRGSSRKMRAADPERLRQLTGYIYEATNEQRLSLITIGDRGLRPSSRDPSSDRSNLKKLVCAGCSGNGCWRATYHGSDGTEAKFMCAAKFFYEELAYLYYGERNEVPFQVTRLCNDYGLDIIQVGLLLRWLMACKTAGIMTDENTGIPLSKMGSLEFMQNLTKSMALRDGFGEVLANGLGPAADMVGKGSKELLFSPWIELSDKSQEPLGADARLFIPIGVLHATTARFSRPQYLHMLKPLGNWLTWVEKDKDAYVSSEVYRSIARQFLGSELAIDPSTYDGKALAAKLIQDRDSWVTSLVLCAYVWPIMTVKNIGDHVGDPELESKVFSAVTGKEVDQETFQMIGERIFNLERATHIRDGRMGRKSDTLPELYYTVPLDMPRHSPEGLVPGMGPEKGGDIISRKGVMVDRAKFQSVMDEYYQLRGWDVTTGLQTRAKLEELGLGNIALDKSLPMP